MRKLLLFIAAVSVITANAQTKSEKQPEEKIIINKEFDDAGNLIRYDSSYSFQWFSDTTFRFPEFWGWQDFANKNSPFFELFADSMLINNPFFNNFPGKFFDNDDWQINPFSISPLDSSFMRNFSFQMDTTLFMGPDSTFLLPPGFVMPNMNSFKELIEQFEKFPGFNDPSSDFYQFQHPKQDYLLDENKRNEWDLMMKRHQEEMQELIKKWENLPDKTD